MKYNNIIFNQIKVQLFMLLIIITLFWIFPIGVNSQTLYFVHNGPVGSIETPQIYYETKIFEYEVENNILSEIWTLGGRQETRKIGVYPSEGKILISSSLQQPNRLYIFSVENIQNPIIIDLDTNIVITDFRYYSNSNGNDFVEVRTNDRSKQRGQGFASSLFTVSDGKLLADKDLANYGGEIRLSGNTPIGSPTADAINIRNISAGIKSGTGTMLGFELNSVDSGIIQQGSSKGWTVLANEPAFYALTAVPDRNDLEKTELLIYDRTNQKWNSILLPGTESYPHLVNNWLVGHIRHKDPESNYEGGPLFGQKIARQIIFVNPLNALSFFADLGPAVEVLWIEGDVVYYKSADNLYKARIVGDEIVDRVKLLNDPPIRYFVYGLMDKSIQNKESKLTK